MDPLIFITKVFDHFSSECNTIKYNNCHLIGLTVYMRYGYLRCFGYWTNKPFAVVEKYLLIVRTLMIRAYKILFCEEGTVHK